MNLVLCIIVTENHSYANNTFMQIIFYYVVRLDYMILIGMHICTCVCIKVEQTSSCL